LTSGTGRTAQLAADKRPEAEKIRDLYLAVYGRYPASDEMAIAVKYIQGHEKQKKQAYEDLLWAPINTKEFLFNH